MVKVWLAQSQIGSSVIVSSLQIGLRICSFDFVMHLFLLLHSLHERKFGYKLDSIKKNGYDTLDWIRGENGTKDSFTFTLEVLRKVKVKPVICFFQKGVNLHIAKFRDKNKS